MSQSNSKDEAKKELTVEYEVEGQKIKLTQAIVQNYIVGSKSQITVPEFKFFTELCKARNLNPFLKEVYLIKYESEPAQLVVSKDVILRRAIQHPQYDGKESGVIVRNAEGEIVEKTGCFVDIENETLLGAWCKVYRKDKAHPEYVSVSLAEVGQKKADGTFNTNWSKKAATMCEKVAKVRALRESFVDELAGMYEEDEFNVAKEESKVESKDNKQEKKSDPLEEAIDVEVVEQKKEEEVDINAL